MCIDDPIVVEPDCQCKSSIDAILVSVDSRIWPPHYTILGPHAGKWTGSVTLNLRSSMEGGEPIVLDEREFGADREDQVHTLIKSFISDHLDLIKGKLCQ